MNVGRSVVQSFVDRLRYIPGMLVNTTEAEFRAKMVLKGADTLILSKPPAEQAAAKAAAEKTLSLAGKLKTRLHIIGSLFSSQYGRAQEISLHLNGLAKK